jgi:uncharacterized peptidase lmo0363
MHKKLFLSSCFKEVAALLPECAGELSGKRVVFIPAASVVEKVAFFVKSGEKALEKLGMVVDELDLIQADAAEIRRKIADSDAIYICGGNTFFLLQEMKRTGADTLIAAAVHAGKLYIGESAGAMVAAHNIEYAALIDTPKKAPDLQSFAALGLVDFYPVPHYTNPPFQKAAHKMAEQYGGQFEIKAISNHEAIWVDGDNIAVKSVAWAEQ